LAVATANVATLVEPPAVEDEEDDGNDGPGRIVREKEHPAKPMTIDQALFEMELVGRLLPVRRRRLRPSSVVYRRHATTTGWIRLTV